MSSRVTTQTLAQPFLPVKSTINTPLPLFPDSVIHHNSSRPHKKVIVLYSNIYSGKPYGVSSSYRILPPQRFLKSYDRIRECLQHVLGLSTAQREVTLRLLRFWAYYGNVYPKAATVAEEPGCSKATFWRAIRNLKDRGLILVVNRYVIRPHAQISNLYLFDKLIIVIARYLAEHGVQFFEKWLRPALTMPGREFWSQVLGTPEARSAPVALAYSGP